MVPVILAKRERKDEISGHKWLLPVTLAAILLIGAIGIFNPPGKGSTLPYAGQTLSIYLPGEYMGEEIVPNFEELTGATVVMENFESNEQMYIKIANGESYDVLITSEYIILLQNEI